MIYSTNLLFSFTTIHYKKNMENDKKFMFGKINMVLIVIGFAIIVLGFILMSGSGTVKEFNPDIFSFRRITVGPMISLFGFISIIFAILYKPKTKE